jgi:hypothetical protein
LVHLQQGSLSQVQKRDLAMATLLLAMIANSGIALEQPAPAIVELID